ncbi:MAG: Gfo/Idh/MocA family protein [Planctomycetota bacterium]|jgi:predicted dehydrogenase
MSQKKLKTAIMGLGASGGLLLDTALGIDCLEVCAIADQDTQIVHDRGRALDCKFYDDYRQLITQDRYDCLLVGESLHRCDQYVRAALKNKCHVFKLDPPARNLEETAELVALAQEYEVNYVVANLSRVSEAFNEFKKFLSSGSVEHVFLITAISRASQESQDRWRSDPKLSGGGVLLYDCYDLIDQIVMNFDLPESVYALSTNTAGDRQQRLYLAEDTAIVNMNFTQSLIANLTVWRQIKPESQRQLLKAYTKDKIISVGRNRFTVTDHQGTIELDRQYQWDRAQCVKKLVENFALSVISPDKNKLLCPSSANLRNMAVIEAAYLSARTAMPEEPARVLQMSKLESTTQKVD